MIFFFGLFILAVSSVVCEDGSALRIKQGKLAGIVAEAGFTHRLYYSFKGIPYAEPPLGKLRFQPPKPHKGWKATFNATKHGNVCPQIDPDTDADPFGNEDCLFLNVYTPFLKKHLQGKDALPVMMFIHGGFFRFGSGNSKEYGPDYFMDEDVVLVTINYRLGVLGFLDLEDPIVPGNMGLKDMLMALNWIKDNIEAFGGDPKKVTIFGNGSGGIAVDLLVLSPLSKGLFQRAICQSGVSLQSAYLDWGGKSRAVSLAELFKISSTKTDPLVKAFRELRAFDFPPNLTKTVDIYESINKQFGVIPFSPSISKKIDGAFITEYPEEVFSNGELPNPYVTIMLGFTSQEAIYSTKYYVQRPPFLAQINKRFHYLFPLRGLYAKYGSHYYHEIAYRLKHFYFTNGTLDPSVSSAMDEFLTFHSDLLVYPTYKTAKAYANFNKAPVYYYRFDFEGELNHFKRVSTRSLVDGENVKIKGASERDELCYMFKCNFIKSEYKKMHEKENSTELIIIKRMIKLWTNFAKYGNPTQNDDGVLNGLNWKPVTNESLNYLDIGEDLIMDVNPHVESTDFWDAIYEYYEPLAVNGVLGVVKDEL